MNGVVAGDGLAVGQEFALQPAGHQHGVPHLEHHVAGALGDGGRLVHVAANFFHFGQGRAGHYEREGLRSLLLVDGLVAEGQAVAVHRHDGQPLAVHLKQGAGVDGAAFVVADGEKGLADHGF